MKCQNCGEELSPNGNVCPNCQTSVSDMNKTGKTCKTYQKYTKRFVALHVLKIILVLLALAITVCAFYLPIFQSDFRPKYVNTYTRDDETLKRIIYLTPEHFEFSLADEMKIGFSRFNQGTKEQLLAGVFPFLTVLVLGMIIRAIYLFFISVCERVVEIVRADDTAILSYDTIKKDKKLPKNFLTVKGYLIAYFLLIVIIFGASIALEKVKIFGSDSEADMVLLNTGINMNSYMSFFSGFTKTAVVVGIMLALCILIGIIVKIIEKNTCSKILKESQEK